MTNNQFKKMRKAHLYGLYMRKLYDREIQEKPSDVPVLDVAWDDTQRNYSDYLSPKRK